MVIILWLLFAVFNFQAGFFLDDNGKEIFVIDRSVYRDIAGRYDKHFATLVKDAYNLLVPDASSIETEDSKFLQRLFGNAEYITIINNLRNKISEDQDFIDYLNDIYNSDSEETFDKEKVISLFKNSSFIDTSGEELNLFDHVNSYFISFYEN